MTISVGDGRVTLAASVIQAFAPILAGLLTYGAHREPVFQVVAIVSTVAGLLPCLIPGIVLTAMEGTAGFSFASWERGEDIAAPLLVVFVVVSALTRFGMCYAVLYVDTICRAHKQVLMASRFRLLPLGVAVGLGIGVARNVVVFATAAGASAQLLFLSSEGPVRNAPPATGLWVDARACSYVPHLYLRALQALLSISGELAWSATTIVGMAALRGPTGVEQTRHPQTQITPNGGRVAIAAAFVAHAAFSLCTLANTSADQYPTYANTACMITVPIQVCIVLLSCTCVLGIARRDAITSKSVITRLLPPAHVSVPATEGSRITADDL
jgi:hypothetical protein